MIVKQRQLFYFVNDQPFKSLEEAQKFDLAALVKAQLSTCPVDNQEFPGVVADWILANAAAITDILTTTPTSRARARKTNGAKKTRKSTRLVLQPAKLPEA